MDTSTELKTDVLKHGTRVRLTIDMPDELYPLFAGDEGTIFDNALLGGSEAWLGFTSDRYADDGQTSISRIIDGKKVQVVDFCEPIEENGVEKVLRLLDEALYALSHVTTQHRANDERIETSRTCTLAQSKDAP